MQETRTHDISFSIAKALGIISVVISHALNDGPAMPFLYYFNTAIFFFAAGYFFRDSDTAYPKRFFRRKILRLYLPYVVIGIVFVLLHNTLLKWQFIGYDFTADRAIQPYGSRDTIYYIGRVLLFSHHEQPLMVFWFLRGLFFGLTLFFGITYIAQRLTPTPKRRELFRGIAIFLLSTAALLRAKHLPGLPGEGTVNTTCVIAGIIYLGKLYSIYRERIRLKGYIAALCFAALAVTAYHGYFINVGAASYSNPLLFWPITGAGCYMLLTLATYIASLKNRFTGLMDYCGRHTMAIMLWHVLLFKLVTLTQIWIYGYPVRYLCFHPVIPKGPLWWCIVYTIVGIAIPLVICRIYDIARSKRYARP